MRIRALAKLDKNTSGDSSGAEFYLPIKTVGTSSVSVEDEYYEFADDSDGNFLLGIETDGLVPFVHLQFHMGTVGGDDADVDYCQVTKRM